MSDLNLQLAINNFGSWLELDDEGDYELGAGTMSEIASGLRERKIEGEWVEGEFTVSAVRTNEIVPVEVWVRAPNPLALQQRLQTLKDAFQKQLQYTMRLRWDNVQELWSCQPARLRVVSSGPLMMALEAQLVAEVPRLPSIIRSAYP